MLPTKVNNTLMRIMHQKNDKGKKEKSHQARIQTSTSHKDHTPDQSTQPLDKYHMTFYYVHSIYIYMKPNMLTCSAVSKCSGFKVY